jgi:tetratricopeptide (TPR) repeat protein
MLRRTLIVLALSGLVCLLATGQAVLGQSSKDFTIHGRVLDSTGTPVREATVRLQRKGDSDGRETETDANGMCSFTGLAPGTYSLVASKSELRSLSTVIAVSVPGELPQVDLVLNSSRPESAASSPSSSAPLQGMEFVDNPTFTIAGVTDWTAAGGHGSDASLRTSEALAREALALKPNDETGKAGDSSGIGAKETESKLRTALVADPESFEPNHQLGKFYLDEGRYQESVLLLRKAFGINPKEAENEYELAVALKETGDFPQARENLQRLLADGNDANAHRLAGEIDEKTGEPLEAVHEFEHAVSLDPSEQNYFEWGSELLFHRAVWQAKEVFEHGVSAYPRSVRLLTALGSTLFAGALYDQAALRLCQASDLDPADPEPYLFMGKVEIATPNPLPCVEQTLERFVRQHPENSLANYFFAMTIWKGKGKSLDEQTSQTIEALLAKAVAIDPKCGDAFLQLGNLKSSQLEFRKAIDFYVEATEANPQLSEAHYRLGVAYDRIGEKGRAKREFDLHDEIEKRQAAEVERQRREVKQFQVVVSGKPAGSGEQ